VNDCFERSMNGKHLPEDDPRMADILAYMASLGGALPAMPEARGRVEGQGIRRLKLERAPDEAAGAKVYDARCVQCHGAEGQGVVAGGVVAFPPLWGDRSVNIAAGMARLHTAAGFIHDHMPLGQGGTLSADEAWDVAAFVTRKPRPDFPAKVKDWPKGGKPEDARS
jgi:thiosulfate dehydrogenase